MEQQPPARLRFLGRPLDALTMAQAVERCSSWARSGERRRSVMTVNAAMLVMMQRDEAMARACEEADLVVADGVPVVWAARLAGHPLPERVAGIDLMTRLLRRADAEGWRVFLLGAQPAVVERLAMLLRRRLPGLAIVGARDGYFSEEESSAVAAQVAASRADILFLGMPSPLKERWISRHHAEVGSPVVIGVGGSFDVLAGRIRRAPPRMQRLGLEWAWRLSMEPRRLWRRYLVTNSQFIVLAAREIVARRLGKR